MTFENDDEQSIKYQIRFITERYRRKKRLEIRVKY